MPSFDVVSQIDKHELINAVDQANREIDTRYDFRGSKSIFELKDNQISMKTESEFQLEQMYQMLIQKLSRRDIDIRSLELKDADIQVKTAKQTVNVKEGLETTDCKNIVKIIKASKLKVQADNQGDKIRVTAKKRDVLQQVIQILKDDDSINLPLQFKNFKD